MIPLILLKREFVSLLLLHVATLEPIWVEFGIDRLYPGKIHNSLGIGAKSPLSYIDWSRDLAACGTMK